MFGVAEFKDGHYEEVDVVDCKKDSICFITSDGTRYKYEENRRFLFQKYRPDYMDWVFINNIRRVMLSATDDGKHELRGYLKKGEKGMNKHDLTKQFLAAQEAVEKARKSLESATENLKKVEKMMEEQAKKKPKMVYKNGPIIEIKKYKKYSDNYIEFETVDGRSGRYIGLGTSKTYTYPNNKASVVLESHIGHVFEMYDFISHKYTEANLIDHIELLEGVVEYADGWVRKENDE